ncbi:MAG: nitroreductase family deazaflavin-dependent oxidoreductase [Actinomycetota bacterium]|nr:nitroreductase family deazaflavin-dependent oxidoreductase [Actinomycetota bacterium]
MTQDQPSPGGATSREEQRKAYLEGEWGNPLTTTKRTGPRILNALQQPFFMLLPPRGYAVLTTTGRKTGKRRRKCVRAIRDGDKVYLVSLPGRYSSWFRNIQGQPQVNLRMRGGTFQGTAREIRDRDEYETARAIYCGTLTVFDRLSYLNHRTGLPTSERIRGMLERWFTVCTPLVVELSG